MIESVVAHDGTGLQSSSQKKNVCGTCGKEFSRHGNLRIHEETQHTNQNTPEAVAKRRKRTTYCNTRRRERRANDPVYRENEKQMSRTNRLSKTACQVSEDGDHTGVVSNDVQTKDVSIPVETEAEKEDEAENEVGAEKEVEAEKKDEAEKKGDGVRDGDRVGGADERVKKAHKKDKTTGVLRVETTVLTTANVTSFFAPTYSAPRSKEQRVANPRPSVI